MSVVVGLLNRWGLEESVTAFSSCELQERFLLKCSPNQRMNHSYDGKVSGELTIEQIVHGPPEYSQWESRN